MFCQTRGRLWEWSLDLCEIHKKEAGKRKRVKVKGCKMVKGKGWKRKAGRGELLKGKRAISWQVARRRRQKLRRNVWRESRRVVSVPQDLISSTLSLKDFLRLFQRIYLCKSLFLMWTNSKSSWFILNSKAFNSSCSKAGTSGYF